MSTPFHVIIPARLKSTRLPGKLMMELQGMSVLERVYLQALKAHPERVIIATDSDQICSMAESFGAHVEMTAITHQSGTDRIAEVVARGDFSADDIIVNVQGDEPLISPLLIQQVADVLTKSDAPMATLCWPITDSVSRDNPNVVKVVCDTNDNALYFSRSAIPFHRNNPDDLSLLNRHIGLYAYRAQFLLDLVKHPVCPLEQIESLEQLRVLWMGHRIRVEKACVQPLQDINTYEDLEQAKQLLA